MPLRYDSWEWLQQTPVTLSSGRKWLCRMDGWMALYFYLSTECEYFCHCCLPVTD